MRTCKSCGNIKPYDQFKLSKPSKRKATCLECLRIGKRANRSRWLASERIRRAEKRATGESRVADIFSDSRKSDRRAGRAHSITVVLISTLIAQECAYCGETSAYCQMTIDRIDNSLGHTPENCVPACSRCNLTRGNMPYEAWLYLCSGMRAARENGAFGTWMGPRLGARPSENYITNIV